MLAWISLDLPCLWFTQIPDYVGSHLLPNLRSFQPLFHWALFHPCPVSLLCPVLWRCKYYIFCYPWDSAHLSPAFSPIFSVLLRLGNFCCSFSSQILYSVPSLLLLSPSMELCISVIVFWGPQNNIWFFISSAALLKLSTHFLFFFFEEHSCSLKHTLWFKILGKSNTSALLSSDFFQRSSWFLVWSSVVNLDILHYIPRLWIFCFSWLSWALFRQGKRDITASLLPGAGRSQPLSLFLICRDRDVSLLTAEQGWCICCPSCVHWHLVGVASLSLRSPDSVQSLLWHHPSDGGREMPHYCQVSDTKVQVPHIFHLDCQVGKYPSLLLGVLWNHPSRNVEEPHFQPCKSRIIGFHFAFAGMAF